MAEPPFAFVFSLAACGARLDVRQKKHRTRLRIRHFLPASPNLFKI
jgi:hypothetical protein